MATDVVMPQMGESIFEGTVTKWLKKPGDSVERDEPLFEISTDKVDAEIPSPVAGTLQQIKVEAGATVQVNVVVATIESAGIAAASSSAVPTENVASRTVEAGTRSADTSATEVVMPQMGESIFEGTITKWLKQVGDSVERDEPLFEISTDKVDAEIPSAASGVLREIRFEAGATVQINSIVAVIESAGSATAEKPKEAARVADAVKPSESSSPSGASQTSQVQSSEKLRSSPLVRKMARENGLNLEEIGGTGSAGRITKEDLLSHLEQKVEVSAVPVSAPVRSEQQAPAVIQEATAGGTEVAGQLVAMTKMRSIIAQRMVDSKRTNAHVHTIFKVDMTRIVRLREKEKSKYEQRNGVKLTYMPFIARAVTATLAKMPIVNASIETESIRYHANVNLGIAVALDWGLIVPVIQHAEERNFLGMARAIADLADRARTKKLKPHEVGTGTFTLTNAGIYGEQFGTPIINMPESAILGIGGLTKEPAVVTDEHGADSIAIRHMIHLTLGFDHRIIDGSDAGKFMAEVKKYLEQWNENLG